MKLDFTKFATRGYVTNATPIEKLDNLSNHLNNECDAHIQLYVKRDDLLPGASGGNKTRKLDFCLAEAMNDPFRSSGTEPLFSSEDLQLLKWTRRRMNILNLLFWIK